MTVIKKNHISRPEQFNYLFCAHYNIVFITFAIFRNRIV